MSNYPSPYQAIPTPPPGTIQPTQAQQPPREPTPRERIARLRVLVRRALSYWKVALLIVVIGMPLSVVMALRVKLIYRSETVILYKPAIKTNDHDEESPADRAQRMAPKLKEVLITRSRLEAIIKEFDLYPKVVESRGMLEAVDSMRDHVGFRGRDSETFFISFENESPEIAQKVTQRLADTMMDEFTKSSVSDAKQQAEFLGQQEQKSAEELENANKAFATFLSLHPEFALEAAKSGGAATPGGAPAMPMPIVTLPKDPAAMGDSQLSVLFRERARLEAALRAAQSGTAPPTPGSQAQAEQIAKLSAQRDEASKQVAAAQADLNEKKTRLTDEHPDVKAAKAAMGAALQQLRNAEVQLASAQALANGQNNNPYAPVSASDAERRIARLNAEIAARQAAVKQAANANVNVDAGAVEAVAETNELVQLETEWQRLIRVLHDVKNEHDDLKQRLERSKLTANAAVATGGDQMQILDAAYLPMRPSQGGRSKTAMMGGIATLMLALAYAFARVLMNDTIIDAADVEALHVIPVLGVLPKLNRAAPAAGPAKGGARGAV